VYFLSKAKDIASCIETFTITIEDALAVLESLLFGASQIYAATDIVHDSVKSAQSNRCNFQVHDISVDLGGELREVYSNYKRMQRDIRLSRHVGAMSFHSELFKIFAQLNDARTQYLVHTHIYYLLPVEFRLQRDSNQRLVVSAFPASSTNDELRLQKNGARVLTQGGELTEINGVDAIIFLQNLADMAGGFMDAGQRLNKFLLQRTSEIPGLTEINAVILELGVNVPVLPSSVGPDVALTFRDGQVVFVDWLVLMNRENVIEALSRCSDADRISSTLELHTQSLKNLKSAREGGLVADLCSLVETGIEPSQEQLALDGNHSDGAGIHRRDRMTTLAAGSSSSTDLYPSARSQQCISKVFGKEHPTVIYSGELYGREVATVLATDRIVILKLADLRHHDTVLDIVKIMFKAFAELLHYSRSKGIKRLLIDVISSYGGHHLVGDLLQGLVLRKWHAEQRCSKYDRRITEYWKEWARALGSSPSQTQSQLMACIWGTSKHRPKPFPLTWKWITDPGTLEQFLGRILFEKAEHYFWGGRETSHSKRDFREACRNVGILLSQENLWDVISDRKDDALMPEHLDHAFEDIAVVTDGLAVDASGMLVSNLLVSGYATVFTFGGDGTDQGFDISGSIGDPAEAYDSWMRKSMLSAELGNALTNGSFLDLREAYRGQHADNKIPHIPLASVSARFAVDNVYLPELSEDALPRNFYRLPAHKNYHDWSYRYLDTTCGNPQRLSDLYARIEREDWCSIRLNPRHADNGVSRVCMPKDRNSCSQEKPSKETLAERNLMANSREISETDIKESDRGTSKKADYNKANTSSITSTNTSSNTSLSNTSSSATTPVINVWSLERMIVVYQQLALTIFAGFVASLYVCVARRWNRTEISPIDSSIELQQVHESSGFTPEDQEVVESGQLSKSLGSFIRRSTSEDQEVVESGQLSKSLGSFIRRSTSTDHNVIST
jgi:hypothetical protein